MKILASILLLIPCVFGEVPPYPARGIRPNQPLTLPSQSQIRPHTVYGPPPQNNNNNLAPSIVRTNYPSPDNKIESLDVQNLPSLNPARFRGVVNQFGASSNQNAVPQTSYGPPPSGSANRNINVKILPSANNQPQTTYGVPNGRNNNQMTQANAFSNSDNVNNVLRRPNEADKPNTQYLPSFEATNFNQDFDQSLNTDGSSQNNFNARLPNNNNQYVPPENDNDVGQNGFDVRQQNNGGFPNDVGQNSNGFDVRQQNNGGFPNNVGPNSNGFDVRQQNNRGFSNNVGQNSNGFDLKQQNNGRFPNNVNTNSQEDFNNQYVPPENNDAVNPNVNFNQNIPQQPGFDNNLGSDGTVDIQNVNVRRLPKRPVRPQTGQRLNPELGTDGVNVYYLPPTEEPVTEVPLATVRPILRRRKPVRRPTTTQAPLDEDNEEDTGESNDEENLARPNVAIANAFAGLYYPQDGTLQKVPTHHTKNLATLNSAYSASYQLQNIHDLHALTSPLYNLNVPLVPVNSWK